MVNKTNIISCSVILRLFGSMICGGGGAVVVLDGGGN